jgi:starch synthase
MSRVLMVSSEVAPLCKTGGLADVLGSLPAALRAIGEEVAVVLPNYLDLQLPSEPTEAWPEFPLRCGPNTFPTRILSLEHNGVTHYLIDTPALFARHGIYGGAAGDFPDNPVRYAVLSLGAIAVSRFLFRPDILHCHDWQSSLAPIYLRTTYSPDPTYLGIRTLLTIHNLGYQGRYGSYVMGDIGLPMSLFHRDALEYFGDVNYLKGGIAFADAINTVSPNYAREIQTPEYGFGLDGFLRARASRLSGILNGVDYSEWNPETDPHIARNYSASNLAGKRECKRALLAELGLPDSLDRPLIGIISRFADQKGFDLVEQIAAGIAVEGVAVAVLGSGEPRFEDSFRQFAQIWPHVFGVRIGYDNALAHRIEAGADMFLMPSRYEPCGLSQIYSLRYGTIPIVRATGGLDDTIDPGTGFKFWDYSPWSLMGAIRSALEAWRDRKQWTEMMVHSMAKDFSWQVSAAEYAGLYRRLIG